MNVAARPPRRNRRYVIGVDFGTLSGRALLVDVATGKPAASVVQMYADGVIERNLPGDTKRLPPDTALQNPADYLAVLSVTIPKLLRDAKVLPQQGTRKIIEAFTDKGVAIEELYACGGLAQKNALLMQIYSDVTGRPIKVAESEETCALGAAMHGAVAAGLYPDIHAAAKKMARIQKKAYRPNLRVKALYDCIYGEYTRLHDLFGRDPTSTMKVLKRLKTAACSASD